MIPYLNGVTGMTFAFLLTSGPDRQDRFTLAHLAKAALKQGHQVRIFLMGDGVVHRDWFAQQFDQAAFSPEQQTAYELAICAHNATQCGIAEADSTIIWGSQAEWARYVNQADRVITFG